MEEGKTIHNAQFTMHNCKEGYKKTELGWIPNNWNVELLGEIGEFKNGLNKNKEDFGFGCRFVNIQDAYVGREIDIDKLELINANENEKKIYSLNKGDIILVRSSVKPEGVGYPILYNSSGEQVVYCGFMIRYRYDINKYNPQYMLYQLRSNTVRKKVLALSTVSANTNVNQDSLKQIKIVVPPLKEQQKIAEILSTVDSEIDDTDKLIEKTKELKKGLMQRLLTKGIGHTEFKKTEIGEIPVEWEVKQLGEICEFRQGFQIPRTEQITEFKEGYIRYLYITDFFSDENKLYIKNDEKYYYIEKNDITIANTGNTCGKAFKGAKGVLSNNMFKIFNNTNILSTNYLWQYLNSSMYWNQLYKYFNTAGQPHVGHKNMSQLFITLPSKEEQQKISQILSSVDTQIEEYENKKAKLEELKKGLMQQLLTGKVRTMYN